MSQMKNTKTVDKSDIYKLRSKWSKKGFELINITALCEISLNSSGWCNGILESDDRIYHVKVCYREEEIGVINDSKSYVIDDSKYLFWSTNNNDYIGSDFIIFRKIIK